MKYRLTTIEQDAAGNIHRVEQPLAARSTLAALFRGATVWGYLRYDGSVRERKSATGLTIVEVEFTSEPD